MLAPTGACTPSRYSTPERYVSERSSGLLVAAEHPRQPGLRVADDDDLRVGTRRQLFRRLDALPLEQLLADPRRDDALEVGDALCLDALALGLLLLLLQHELHLLGFLLAPQLFLNRVREHRRQSDPAQ